MHVSLKHVLQPASSVTYVNLGCVWYVPPGTLNHWKLEMETTTFKLRWDTIILTLTCNDVILNFRCSCFLLSHKFMWKTVKYNTCYLKYKSKCTPKSTVQLWWTQIITVARLQDTLQSCDVVLSFASWSKNDLFFSWNANKLCSSADHVLMFLPVCHLITSPNSTGTQSGHQIHLSRWESWGFFSASI